tara:strand:- start:69 stop:776 length:708 start_codon:yes stop_codon:yes gene_type:complete
MLNSQKVFLLILLLTALFFSENIREGFNQFREKLVHSDLTAYECQKRCAEKENCRYANTSRSVHRSQKKGPCYHSFGLKGQYSVNAGNDKWVTMGNKNFIPRSTETESYAANKTGGAAQTIYQQIPAGSYVTKIFYRFNGQDHGYGAPARVPHLAVLDSDGNWHETYDRQKKGIHNTMANDFTFARGSNQWHSAMRAFKTPIKAGSGNNFRIEYPNQASKNITVKKSKFSVEFRN